MYICLCKAVTDSQLDQILQNPGPHSLKSVGALCGAGTDCGSCRPELVQRLENACQNQPQLKLIQGGGTTAGS